MEKFGETHTETLGIALDLAITLREADKNADAKSFLRGRVLIADRFLGREKMLSLRLRWVYANSLTDSADATIDDLVEAVETLESVAKSWKRVMGERHPETVKVLNASKSAREKLRLRRAAGD
jgi:hypothetical protein